MSHLRPSFKPVYNQSRVELPISQTAGIIGGKTIYLEDGERWPVCPSCSEPLVPYIQLNTSSHDNPEAFRQLASLPNISPSQDESICILQLLVCLGPHDFYDACFYAGTVYATDNASWVLRFIHIPLSQANALWNDDLLEGGDSPSGDELTVFAQRQRSYTVLRGKFLRLRNITTWVHAKEETMHSEINWNWVNDDEEFYEEHKPLEGFKLLGYSVRGKFYNGEEDCPKGIDPEHSWRELLQLGGNFDDPSDEENQLGGDEEEVQEDALTQMVTIGNSWIAQCTGHPDIVHLFMSGDW